MTFTRNDPVIPFCISRGRSGELMLWGSSAEIVNSFGYSSTSSICFLGREVTNLQSSLAALPCTSNETQLTNDSTKLTLFT